MNIVFVFIILTRELAENVWNKANLDLHMNNLAENLLEDITSKNPDIQEAGAKALATLLTQLDSSMVNTIVKKLMNVYQEKLKVRYVDMPVLGLNLLSLVTL